MNQKMTLLYVEPVGQVVAALTRTGSQDAADPAVVAGTALAVRWDPGTDEFSVPAEEIAAVAVDRDDAVLFEHLDYHVVDGAAERLSTVMVSGVALSGTDVTVTVDAFPKDLPVPATKPVAVWVLFQGGAVTPPVVARAELAIDKKSVALKPALDDGAYDVFAMVAGYKPFAASITVP